MVEVKKVIKERIENPNSFTKRGKTYDLKPEMSAYEITEKLQ